MIGELTSYRYNQGDEIALPFLCKSQDGSIVDITGLTITAEVWVRGVLTYTLTTGTDGGIEITETNPELNPDDQTEHGMVRISEDDAAALPFGAVAYLKIILVDPDNVTASSEPIYLNKVLP